MLSALDIADFVLKRAGAMSSMKLQKLVYYSQAWALTLLGRPLFREGIQAWAFGPVVYELFDKHRGRFAVDTIDGGHGDLLQGEARRLVEAVVGFYGTFDGAQLSERTHAERPWREARVGLDDAAHSSSTISHGSMASFYSQAPVPFAWPASR